MFAFDRSARTYDIDGHLHVRCTLTKAIVNDYMGSEIFDAERLGLDPARVYKVWRVPAELEKSISSLEGKPLLREHKVATSDDYPQSLVIGTVSNVSYDNGTVYGDLSVWDADAIDEIERGAKKEISLGYRWVPVLESGVTPDRREPYDLRMTDIRMNHAAIVPTARVAGAMVADSLDGWRMLADTLQTFTRQKKRTKRQMANSKLRAFDASFRKLIGCKAKDEDQNGLEGLLRVFRGSTKCGSWSGTLSKLALHYDAAYAKISPASARAPCRDLLPFS